MPYRLKALKSKESISRKEKVKHCHSELVSESQGCRDPEINSG